MNAITVKNESGQVVSLSFDGDHDPRKQIVEQRIARGELTKVTKSEKSTARGRRGRQAVVDYHTGLRDEKGDLLKSVHGGGLDPDAQGDEMGQPSGSEPVEGAIEVGGKLPVGDNHPDAAVDAPNKDVEGGDKPTETAKTAKKAAPAKKS